MERIKLLVVEDEVLIQELLLDHLEDGGFEPVSASTARDAMQLLDDDEYRALVTDINLLTDLSGWDIARHARRLYPELPVIYMTGDSAAAWSAEGVPNSVLITKPFAPVQITTALGQLLNVGNTPGV
ncbi:MAG: response regulator [Pseudolabrys sp.]|nr:response regulator [Pseudolabrys sp.]